MTTTTMLYLVIAVGLVILAMGVALARFRSRSRPLILISVLFRFSCLLIGTAATAYWAAAPGGPHPSSVWGSALLLLAYVVSGDERLIRT